MKRNLLTEAIADAKAVKETALANAKIALEEAFTPHLKEMLADKLAEMDMDSQEESESLDNLEETEEEVNLGELVDNLEEEAIQENLLEDESEEDESEEDESEEDESEEDESEEEIDLEDMSEEDLKGFIENVIQDMVKDGELEPSDLEDDEESEEESEEGEDENMEIEVDLNESEVDEDVELEEDSYVDESHVEEGYGDRADGAAGGLETIINSLKSLATKAGPAAEQAKEMLQGLAKGAGQAMRNEELEELKEVKKELQEVNLLNAKLLYTNKIFKSKTLSEDKKIKVLKAFDKATTVKDAKFIYETLNEGIVSINKTSKPSRRSIREHKGSASKPMGIKHQVKQPIVENASFLRMQKLAGIIK